MGASEANKNKSVLQRIFFAGLVLISLLLQGFYAANAVKWTKAPDPGWDPMVEMGPSIIAFVNQLGEAAGLRPKDKILAVNGKTFKTFDEQNAILNFEVGGINIYQIEREGKVHEVSVKNGMLGLRQVALRLAPTWVFGLIYFALGLVVFLMKPYHGPSWAFLIMSVVLSIFFTYSTAPYFFDPLYLNKILLIAMPFLPATIFHLAAFFPLAKKLAVRRVFLVAPCGLSTTLAALILAVADRIASVPFALMNTIYIYLLVSVLAFLGSTIHSYRTTSSNAIRLQSITIFSGMALAFIVPIVDSLLNLILKISIFPNPALTIIFFFTFFPVSVGYAIVRHDLFEIDVIVRRTYGYVLSTATIVAAYALLASVLDALFHTAETSRSPIFSVAFTIAVVLLFRPLQERIQRFVDRLFYRQKYDYRKAIREASQAMTSILNAGAVQRTLLGSLVREMFLENGLFLRPATAGGLLVEATEGEGAGRFAGCLLAGDDPAVGRLRQGEETLIRDDLDLNPRYDRDRDDLQRSFEGLDSRLMMRLSYKGELQGVLSLGRKKSGKMFTPEDLDLLRTITNQSAIALENARLFEENLEKGRMEEELKIAHDLQMGMLPESAPDIEGFLVAAKSLPAREVGGDFYDFIEMGGDGRPKRIGIVVGDVSGKAVSGALVMAAARSIFRVLSDETDSVEAMMNTSNLRLNRDVKKGMFVALLYAALDPKNKTLTISNAGQVPPIVCSPDREKPEMLETTGDSFPLGIVRDCHYQETVISLKSGDNVVFCTDGIVEAMNEKGEIYGFDRLLASVEEGKGLKAQELMQNILADVSTFVGTAEQHDDLTVVVVTGE